MKLVTRTALGWPTSTAPAQATARGVKVHYTGAEVSKSLFQNHAGCLELWKDIRRAHLAHPTEDYSDVAYNYAACVHGYVLEGRGIGRRTGANGNQTLNRAHYAVLGLIGNSGLTEPTDKLLNAIRDAIEHLRKHGADTEIQGHKDGYATSCPGGPLYAWVRQGAPRVGGETPVIPPTKPGYEPFPGAGFFMAGTRPALGKRSAVFTAMGKRLVAKGFDEYYTVGPGPVLGQADVRAYEAFQRSLRYTGSAAKWPPGPTSWSKLQVPNV